MPIAFNDVRFLGVKRTSGGERHWLYLCAVGLTRPRRRKAFHLLLDALNGAAADAALASTFSMPLPVRDALFKRGIDPRPTELLALRYVGVSVAKFLSLAIAEVSSSW
jgi:hypothetical protein